MMYFIARLSIFYGSRVDYLCFDSQPLLPWTQICTSGLEAELQHHLYVWIMFVYVGHFRVTLAFPPVVPLLPLMYSLYNPEYGSYVHLLKMFLKKRVKGSKNLSRDTLKGPGWK